MNLMLFDARVIENWIDCIPVINFLFNSSVKAPICGASNLIIFGQLKLSEKGIF